MMESTIYERFLFVKFFSSAAKNLDLKLAKHQQFCLVNECSHMEVYLRSFARTSLNIIVFVRFCISLQVRGSKVDLGLSLRQTICLYKECIKIAQYYEDANALEGAILIFVMFSKRVSGYEEQSECEEAIVYGKKCIDIGKEMGCKQREMDACYVVGKAFLCIKKYQDAILYFKKSLDIAKETCKRNAVMYVCLELGRAHAGLQQYDDAINYWRNCIEITKETGNREIEMHVHLEVGRAYRSLKNFENVIISCKKCIAIAMETGNSTIEIYGYFELGKAYEELLQYKDANVCYNHCIQMAEDTGNNDMEMKAYGRLQMTHAQLKLHNDAIRYGRKCIDIAKHIGDIESEKYAYHILVEIYKDINQYDKAICCSKKCVDIAKEIGCKSIEMNAYLVVADVLLIAEQYEESMEYSKKGLEISEQTCDSYAEMASYLLLGLAYDKLMQHENAIFFFKKCIDAAKKNGDKMIEVRVHHDLVRIFLSFPMLNQALLHLNEGKNIAQELNNNEFTNAFRDLQHTLNVIVGIYNEFFPKEQIIGELIDIPNGPEQDLLDAIDEAVKTNDLEKESLALLRHFCFCHSKKEYKKALASLKHLKKVVEGDTGTKLWCNIVILRSYILMSQHDQALEYCWEILTDMKEIGNSVHQSLFYSILGQLLYRDGQWNASEKYLREALQYFELIFASLGSNDEFKISIVDKYHDCYKCLSIVLTTTNQVEEALLVSDRCRARALKDLLVSNFGMNEEGSDEEQKNYPEIQAFAASNNGFSVLFYSLFYDGVLLFFTDTNENTFKSDFQLFEISEKGPRFLNLIDHAFDEINVRKVGKCEDRSLDANPKNTKRGNRINESVYASCTNALLGMDVSQCVTGSDSRGERSQDLDLHGNALTILYDTLIGPVKNFVDQDEIVIIPDGQLNCVPFSALRDPDTGKYLSETKRIRLAPSIATLNVLQERPADQHHRKGALIIGNPLVGKVMMYGEEQYIEPLFGALDEAIDIALMLGVRPLVAADATKPAVLEKLRGGVSVVHIAAHGILSKATIVLAPSPEIRATKIPDEEDYMLTMADVQQTQVRAQLVVLSCCHSGRGEIRAEGVVGMCRAFLASGARAVVASLWAIDDDATLEFMKTFYKHLKSGKSASRSLQMAMNDMRQSVRFNEPKYWAPFFLIGDDVTIDFTD